VLYPNPVASELNISTSSETVQNVLIYNMNGTVVKSVNNADSIDMSNLNTGNYLVKVTTDKGTVVKKIAKK
jgi:hypothetical protein